MKDIDIIDIDYTAKDPAYKKEDKVVVAKISGPWIVPEEGPVYADSVRVIKGGLDLIPETDFTCVEEVTDLTVKTGKKVVLYIQLKDHIIQGNGELDLIYQRVGLPIISTKKLIETLEDMIIKGKPVDFDTGVTNKPATYYPSWHSHDIQNSNEMVGFGGLVELFSRLTWEQKGEGTKMQELLTNLQKTMYDKLDYVHKLKWGAIMTHSRNYNNPHKVVKGDVGCSVIDNVATATPQEDSEGRRSDLRSTPAGLARLIQEAAPVTEDYLVQNELPFGYYGSGIYLPPPITGSFEGLGGDVENSAFLTEGNGWTVGLIRGYDGRVRNLYYVYTEDIRDRNNGAPWVHTYVQYVHPAIRDYRDPNDPATEDKDKRKFYANTVVSGSNQDVLCLGDVAWGNNDMVVGRDKMWICAANSTFDPNSHTMKPIDIVDKVVGTGLSGKQSGRGTIARVGDWVYYIHSFASNVGDAAGYYIGGVENWQQRMWRFKYSDLTNPSVLSITLQPVNVTFDNLDRERRTNQPAFFMIRQRGSANNITEGALKFSRGAISADSHRRRQFCIVPNPNNPRYARVRIFFVTYTTVRNVSGDGTRGLWQDLIVDYDWDVETNTWTIDKNWRKPSLDISAPGNGRITDINDVWNAGRGHASHTNQFVYTSGSYVRGVGYVSMGSVQTGVPPFMMCVSIFNKDQDPRLDYYWLNQPANWTDAVGRANVWRLKMVMKSPFGVAGFPRHYSDLYALTDGVRATPIEVFYAENEAQTQQYFYRIAETDPASNGYDYRTGIQSNFVPRSLYGRATNSNFGTVNGMNQNVGTTNRPTRPKSAQSFANGHMSYLRNNLIKNPGAAPQFSWKINDAGNMVAHSIESNGDVIINLAMDWRYDTPTKILFARPNKNKCVRIPRSIWQDMVRSAIGADINKTLDYMVSFYLADQPGAGDAPWSHWCVHYHTTDAPALTRTIAGIFHWSVAGTVDGIRQVKFDGMRYPYYAAGLDLNKPLKPGSTTNITAGPDHHALNEDGTWMYLGYSTGTDVKHTHMEILDKGAGGSSNMEMGWQPGSQINTPGNMTGDCFFLRVVNGVAQGEMRWNANRAFNWEFTQHIFANAQHGWLQGVESQTSGGAMCLMTPWGGFRGEIPTVQDKYILYGATYVEGNWSVFVNSEVTVTFNGFSMMAKMQNWDLRDLVTEYRNQTFFIYCCANGSTAYYEVTQTLRTHDANKILAATIYTNALGIYEIDKKQGFTISGFPIIRKRDMGVPASSGAVTEAGTYTFINRSDLFGG